MSFEALQERLAALQETTAQVQELINRLAALDFQPGSAPLPVGSGNGDDADDENVATELSAEINQILREEEEDLELLAEEVTDLRGGKDGSEAARRKERLSEGVGRLEAEVKSCRLAFHKAQLTARRSLEAARRLERQVLLRSYTKPASTPSRSGANSPAPSLGPVRRRHTHKSQQQRPDDPVAAASSDLTQSLHRAHRLVQDELARSVALHDHLQDSTAQLRQLGGAYGRMEDLLASSRDLLGTLLTSTKSDTWYLQTTFYLLAATLGWLVFRRWLYGPLWWLVWLPLRIVFRTGSTAVGVGMGMGKGQGAGARMQVVDGAGTRIAVEMSDGAVPTMRAAGAGREEVGDAVRGMDEDSMIEKVGRILDRDEQLAAGTGAEAGVEAEAEAGTGADLSMSTSDGQEEEEEQEAAVIPDERPREEVMQDSRVRDEL